MSKFTDMNNRKQKCKWTILLVLASSVFVASPSIADDILSIFRSEPTMTYEQVRALAESGQVRYNTKTKDDTKNYIGQVTIDYEADLAVISDDGSTVVVNGTAVSSRFGNGQDLYSPDQSVQSAGILSVGTHNLLLSYKNTIQVDANDFNGVTLIAFGGSRPVSSMSVQRVNFSGNSVLNEDSYPTIPFGSPQWNAVRSPIAFPVRYTTGSTPKVNAAFDVNPPNTRKPIYIRGRSGWGHFPPKICTPSSGIVFYPATSANFQVPDTIQSTNLRIEWEFSTDGGQTWKNAGASSNHLYGTIQSSAKQLTAVHIACTAATGQSQPSVIFESIWNHFKSLNVRNFKGEPMRYWGPGAGQIEFSDDAGLVLYANGTCGPWSDFFIATMATQGVALDRVRVTGCPKLVAIPAGSPPQWAEAHEFQVSASARAQNMSPPTEYSFANHVFTKYNSDVYDPSYGVHAYTEQQWEDDRITSITFRNQDTGELRTIVKTNGVKELDYS